MLSILMPAHNAEAFVEAAVGSITQQQLNCPIEILICDDGSTDGTSGVLHSLAAQETCIKLFQHAQNRGIAATRNTLLDNMDPRSQFVVFFDSDDVFAPDGLVNGLARLQAHPDYMFVSGRCQTVPSAELEKDAPVAEHWPIIGGVYLGLAVFRRDLVDRIGKFDSSFTQAEDMDFVLRAGELTKDILFHDDIVYYYRRHAHNITNDMKNRNSSIMRAALLHARRRKADPSLLDARGILQPTDPVEIDRSLALHG